MENDFEFFEDFSSLDESEKENLDYLYGQHYNLVASDNFYLIGRRFVSQVTPFIVLSLFAVFILGLLGLDGFVILTILYIFFSVFYIFFPMKMHRIFSDLYEITPENNEKIYNLFENACNEAGLDVDDMSLYVREANTSSSPIKAYPEENSIIFQSDLIGYIAEKEFVAVLIHEMEHIQNKPDLHRTAVLFTNVTPFLTSIVVYILTWNELYSSLSLLLSLVLFTFLSRFFLRRVELDADESIPENYHYEFVKGSIKILKGVSPHVDSFYLEIFHALIDEHPPLNRRIENTLENGKKRINVPDKKVKSKRREKLWKFLVSSPYYAGFILIMVSFLSPVFAIIEYSIAFYGALLSGFWYPVRNYMGYYGLKDTNHIITSILITFVSFISVFITGISVSLLTAHSLTVDLLGLSVVSVSIVFLTVVRFISTYIENNKDTKIPEFESSLNN